MIARVLPRIAGEIDEGVPELVDFKCSPIILVCRTDKRSSAAAKVLLTTGFEQVSVLRRGMEQWNAAGLPVEDRAAGART